MPLLPPVDSLSLPEQVAQMVVVRASGYLFDQQIQYPDWEPPTDTLKEWVTEWGVGGVILLGGSAAELALRSQQLQDWATIPLLVAADVEEGVGQRFAGATWFPPPMALGAIAQTDPEQACQLATAMGRTIAQESCAVGLNWVLAPVVDVNNNPKNPVINVRAFGDQPEQVATLATAFLQGMQDHPILACAKHFPGHGDTATDSHLSLPLISHDRDRLHQLEWHPFRAMVAANVDAVMSAHLLIPSLDRLYPATLSPRILEGELRQQMGFDGLIVTDALVMGAIANGYGANEAPVLAVEAGADILLMPLDPVGAIQAVVEAVETGRIERDRIRASVERIWHAKHKVVTTTLSGDSSHTWETLPAPRIDAKSLTTQLVQSDALDVNEAILRASMQIYAAPLRELPKETQNLLIVDDALSCEFLTHQSPAIALPRRWGCTLQVCDATSSMERMAPASDPTPPTLLQLFIRGNPFRGSAGLNQMAQHWVEQLLRDNRLQAVLIYGSPYLLQEFQPKLPPPIPCLSISEHTGNGGGQFWLK
ncbi:MAG: glycoside hydrolase family 3 N-terminal domain-containing protein, partial [Cyanobacteria bacterium J06638_22]